MKYNITYKGLDGQSKIDKIKEFYSKRKDYEWELGEEGGNEWVLSYQQEFVEDEDDKYFDVVFVEYDWREGLNKHGDDTAPYLTFDKEELELVLNKINKICKTRCPMIS